MYSNSDSAEMSVLRSIHGISFGKVDLPIKLTQLMTWSRTWRTNAFAPVALKKDSVHHTRIYFVNFWDPFQTASGKVIDCDWKRSPTNLRAALCGSAAEDAAAERTASSNVAVTCRDMTTTHGRADRMPLEIIAYFTSLWPILQFYRTD